MDYHSFPATTTSVADKVAVTYQIRLAHCRRNPNTRPYANRREVVATHAVPTPVAQTIANIVILNKL